MGDKRIKSFEEIEKLEVSLKVLKALYQNPMVFTEELAREEKQSIDRIRTMFNEVIVSAYDYIDNYTINTNTYRGKMLDMVKVTMEKYGEESREGNIEEGYKYLDEHNTMLEYLDNLTKENKEWLENKYVEYMERPIDIESNAVALVGYKLVNAYGDDLNNPAYIKLVKRIYKELVALVENEDIRTFYVQMNKGVSICSLLALHHVKKKYPDVKVVCVEEYEHVSRAYPKDIRGVYKQAMSVADRIVYIEEEMNIRPFGILTKEKTEALEDWILSKTGRTVAVYTLGSRESDVERYLDKAKNTRHMINYVEV